MKRILIVDDREENRYLLEVLLRGRGYLVDGASQGAEALVKARQQPPDVIVSDLLMPVMDGYTLLRHWRTDERLRRIPFVVYTATYTDPKDEQLAQSLGADAFILKPAEPQVFLNRIQEILAAPVRPPAAPPIEAPAGFPARIPVAAPAEEEHKQLAEYSQALIRKLEDKMEQADRANRALQRDIAERQLVEEQLRESERKYRELVEHANCIILRWTAEGRITFLNEFGQKFFGYTLAEIVGHPLLGTILPAPAEPAREGLPLQDRGRGLAGRGAGQQVIENRKRSGQRVWVAWTNKEDLDETGRVRSVTSFGTDITEHRQLEEQLRQSQKLEAIGRLASGVAHDFSNILTIVQGNAALLLDGVELPPEALDYARQIMEAAERAASLTRQLLLFSRKQALHPVRLDLNDAVGNVTRMLQRLLGEHIALDTDYAAGLPPIVADVSMVEQILLNLAVNARDAMPSGGRLSLKTTVENVAQPVARMDPEVKPGRYVSLRIRDTGCGIPQDHLPRIFDPFFTTKEAGKGTGLGLATVYSIVKQHQGWIRVESRVGEGTEFQIFFPVALDVSAESRIDAVPGELPRGNEVILVVEDDFAVRQLLEGLLQRAGYTVLPAPTGVAALEVWRQHKHRIQLLLTDVIMPDGMSGLELAERLRREAPRLKVIYASGYGDEVIASSQGVITEGNFLQKPYSPQKLARAVRAMLDR